LDRHDKTTLHSVLLTKQAVAHRLILSAVRMLNHDSDPLVVHAIAASASNLLRELVARRGKNYGSRVFGVALYEAALAAAEGRPSVAQLPDDPAVAAAIAIIRHGIEEGTISGPEDVDIGIPRSIEHEVMQPITAPFNFMKHSDRDPDEVLDESSLRPVQAIAHAIAAYALLFPGDRLPDEVREFIGGYLGITATDLP
jgi:hypothetical protein